MTETISETTEVLDEPFVDSDSERPMPRLVEETSLGHPLRRYPPARSALRLSEPTPKRPRHSNLSDSEEDGKQIVFIFYERHEEFSVDISTFPGVGFS